MVSASTQDCCFLLCLLTLQVIGRAYGNILNVGEELKKETMPLQSGSRIYQLQGLRPKTWYEVKISYPASSETFVVLTVEPEGVVAIPNGKERETVIYNIVCDELMLGIPHEAWWVVILAVVCLGVAFVIPSFLPSVELLSTDITRRRGATSKNS
ncbi:hypothetical protein HanLR1_Chr03g0105611 [Helianthus annuus]|nr:hypothetical protein HanLR1_Chr03g0105611 [Helianthus annuus]